MKCKKAKILVSASLDGELSRREQIALQRHLSTCAGCAEEKARLSALRDAMSLWADEEPSERLAESFARGLQDLQREKLVRRGGPAARWLLGTAAAGAATALIMVGFLLHGLLVQQVRLPAPTGVVKPPAATERPAGSQPAPRVPQIGVSETASKPPVTGSKPGQVSSPPVRERAPARRYYANRPSSHGHRPGGLASRHPTSMAEAQQIVAAKMAAAGIAQDTATTQVTDDLGEAGLAMNETIERVRGNLQKTVDLIVSAFPAPADDTLNSNGGSAQ